jgi:hypothetical protein
LICHDALSIFLGEAPESFNAVNAYLSLLEFAAVIDIQMPKPTEHQ